MPQHPVEPAISSHFIVTIVICRVVYYGVQHYCVDRQDAPRDWLYGVDGTRERGEAMGQVHELVGE